MSWIKDNKFLVGLIGGTVLGVILLYMVGSSGAKKYQEAQEAYTAAAAEGQSIERLAIYPLAANRDGKRKALDDFRKSTEALQASFAPYRAAEIKNVSPQEFTDHLKRVDAEIRAAFEEVGTEVPEAFFSGFEAYKTSLARRESTGILTYQLQGIRKLLLDLAKSEPTALGNLHRPELPEERNQTFKAGPNEVARRLPIEISFRGPEASARKFVTKVVALDEQFVTIRNIRVRSTKQDAPKSSDVKFDSPTGGGKENEADAGGDGGIFGGMFDELDSIEEEGGDEADTAEEVAPEPEPEVSSDSSRILAQVLGGEDIEVFIRLDLMLFLPEKKLP